MASNFTNAISHFKGILKGRDTATVLQEAKKIKGQLTAGNAAKMDTLVAASAPPLPTWWVEFSMSPGSAKPRPHKMLLTNARRKARNPLNRHKN
jgi:hypothetical protein